MNGRVPRYHRIAESLRGRIRDGEWRRARRCDNQRRLARDFGVTLMTLRQALELLERDRLITRRHGLGTFVAAPSIDYDILKLQRFAGDLSAQGEDVTTRVLEARPATADRRVAAALGLTLRARVVALERLRLVDGRPMSLQRSLPARRASARRSSPPISPRRRCARCSSSSWASSIDARPGGGLGGAPGAARGPRARLSAPACRPSSPSACRSTPPAQPVVFDRVFIPGDRFRITRELHYDPQCEPPLRGATTA